MIKISKPQESLESRMRVRDRPVNNGAHLSWIHTDAIGGHDWTQKQNWHEKRTSQPSQNDDSPTDVVAQDERAGRLPGGKVKKMRMSSRYTKMKILSMSLKTMFTNAWKRARVLTGRQELTVTHIVVLFTKKNPALAGEVEGTMAPAASKSARYLSNVSRLGKDKE